jgi:hypothetical protein
MTLRGSQSTHLLAESPHPIKQFILRNYKSGRQPRSPWRNDVIDHYQPRESFGRQSACLSVRPPVRALGKGRVSTAVCVIIIIDSGDANCLWWDQCSINNTRLLNLLVCVRNSLSYSEGLPEIEYIIVLARTLGSKKVTEEENYFKTSFNVCTLL